MANPSKISTVVREDLVPIEERVKEFSNLLDELESTSDKKKALWKEIYANAITDRNNALLLYNDLCADALLKTINHSLHAPNLAKYIEKMSKANDQLLKLAELIAQAEARDDEINPESIYSALEDEQS